jgi:hypothetical protein
VGDGAGVTTEEGDVVGTTVGCGVLAGCGVLVLGAGLVGGVAGRDVEGTALGEAADEAADEAVGCAGVGGTVATG